MWEINNNLQVVSFLFSLALGVCFCAFYDIFRAVRLVWCPKGLTVFLQDIIYFCILSVVTFIFLLSITNGEIRGYVLFGILLGFLLFYYTLSRYFLIILKKMLRLLNFVFKAINSGFNWFFSKIEILICKFSYFGVKFLKNTLNYCKKLLKKAKGLLYTKH